jgi:hypothetical protein
LGGVEPSPESVFLNVAIKLSAVQHMMISASESL